LGTRVKVRPQPQRAARSGKSAAQSAAPLMQRKCACGAAPGQTCGCDEHDGRKLAIRRRASTHDVPDVVPAVVEEVLRSEGRPLEASVRALMESRLGHDFSHVRVHTDARAAESASAVGALAYTVGRDVVFASGQYRPETREGRRLLAHELAHVVQQGGVGHFDGRLEVGPSDGPEERAADEAAAAVEEAATNIEAATMNVEAASALRIPAATASAKPSHAQGASPAPRQGQGASHVLQRKTGDAASWIRGLFSSLILGTFGFPDSWLLEYLEKLDRTGDIEGDPDSDDKAREIVNTWRKGGSKFVLTEQRKALLIHEMLDGPTTGGDEDAILELLVRSYNYELSYIFGPGGVIPKRLSEDIPDDPGDRLFEFFVNRCEGGHEAALAGKFKPTGTPPVPLGVELPPVGAVISNVELFKGGSTGWDEECVLGILCSEDKKVVSQLPSLDVKKMERIDVKQWKFDGKTWTSQIVHPVGVNKPDDKLVGIIKSTDCNSAAQTFFHEVRHQNQTEDVRKTHYTMEVDAYTETEKWAIARGLPETSSSESLRSTDPRSGVQSPSAKAIEKKVTRIYGGPTDVADEEVKGHEGANTTLVEVNGKADKRQSKEGDKYLEEPPTFAGEKPLDRNKWKCPEQKPGPLIQRKCACGANAGTTGECEDCQSKRAPGLQTKLNVSEPGDRFEAEADLVAERITRMPDRLEHGQAPGLQRQAVTSVGHSHGELSEAPPVVQEVLRSPGRPLDAQTRGFMESRFGHDFSRVRVHTDARAEESARAVHARAYTVRRDIVFSAGRYAPHTGEGRRLIAHELAHVVQQRGAGAPPFNEPHGIFESSAEVAARDVANGSTVSGNLPACGVGLSRAPDSDEDIARQLREVNERLKQPNYAGRDRDLAIREALIVASQKDTDEEDEAVGPTPMALDTSKRGLAKPVVKAAKPAKRSKRSNTAPDKFAPGGFTDEQIYKEYNESKKRIEEREENDRKIRARPIEDRIELAENHLYNWAYKRGLHDGLWSPTGEEVWNYGYYYEDYDEPRQLFTEDERPLVIKIRDGFLAWQQAKARDEFEREKQRAEWARQDAMEAQFNQITSPAPFVQAFALTAIDPFLGAAVMGAQTGQMAGEAYNACRSGPSLDCADKVIPVVGALAMERLVSGGEPSAPVQERVPTGLPGAGEGPPSEPVTAAVPKGGPMRRPPGGGDRAGMTATEKTLTPHRKSTPVVEELPRSTVPMKDFEPPEALPKQPTTQGEETRTTRVSRTDEDPTGFKGGKKKTPSKQAGKQQQEETSTKVGGKKGEDPEDSKGSKKTQTTAAPKKTSTAPTAQNRPKPGALKDAAGEIHGMRRPKGQAIAFVEVKVGDEVRLAAAVNSRAGFTKGQLARLRELNVEIIPSFGKEIVHAEANVAIWVKALRDSNKGKAVQVLRWGVSATQTGGYICSACRQIITTLGGVIEEFPAMGKTY